MKNHLTKVTAIAAVIGLFIAVTPAYAEKYGVIDMTRVMKETSAAKGIFNELESKRAEYQKQVQKEEDTLRTAEQEIIKQRSKLSEEEFNKKRREFEDQLMKAQKMVQERKEVLDSAFTSSMNKLRSEAAKIVAGVAKEKGYSTVFTNEAVILAEPSLDMTDEVVARLNKDVKSISVDWTAKKK